MFEKVLFPLEQRLNDEQAFLGAMFCGIEFLETGCTEVNNMGKTWSQPVMNALEELKLKGTLALALKDVDLKTKQRMECEFLKENEELVRKLRKHPRLKGLFGLANEVEASESLIKDVKLLAKQHGTGVHVHVAESIVEKGFVFQKTGKTSVKYLFDLGVLTPETIAVHAVNVTDSDVTTLAKSQCKVVHCPTANLSLGAGVAPVPKMLEKGVQVCIGVDDPVATPNNDVLKEVFTASIIQQAVGQKLSSQQLSSMLFAGKQLEEGVAADVVLLEENQEFLGKDFLKQLSFGFLDVKHVFINGEQVVDRGKATVVDREKVFENVEEARKDLLAETQ
jgi:5-methylthioadenosine/S-adenosylhomocysteine deaminase